MKYTLFTFLLFVWFQIQAQAIDIDGNTYDTVRIGTQTWMAENLNVDKFRNGDPIAQAKNYNEWTKAYKEKEPAWCYYYNDTLKGSECSKLYNWFAVNDSRGLAPAGYHIPKNDEWALLFQSLDGVIAESFGDTTGFAGLPCGIRNFTGSFENFGQFGYWWSASEVTEYNANALQQNYWTVGILPGSNMTICTQNMASGLSVRCVKD